MCLSPCCRFPLLWVRSGQAGGVRFVLPARVVSVVGCGFSRRSVGYAPFVRMRSTHMFSVALVSPDFYSAFPADATAARSGGRVS